MMNIATTARRTIDSATHASTSPVERPASWVIEAVSCVGRNAWTRAFVRSIRSCRRGSEMDASASASIVRGRICRTSWYEMPRSGPVMWSSPAQVSMTPVSAMAVVSVSWCICSTAVFGWICGVVVRTRVV